MEKLVLAVCNASFPLRGTHTSQPIFLHSFNLNLISALPSYNTVPFRKNLTFHSSIVITEDWENKMNIYHVLREETLRKKYRRKAWWRTRNSHGVWRIGRVRIRQKEGLENILRRNIKYLDGKPFEDKVIYEQYLYL